MAIQAHHISNSSGFVFGGCQDENAYGLNNLRCYNDHRLSIPHIVSAQFETQRFEIHHYLNTQNERLRMALQEQTALLLRSYESKIQSLLKQRDDEISRAGRRKMELEECVRRMEMERVTWQRLAQEGEATAASLRARMKEAGSCCVEREREPRKMVCRCCNSRKSCVIMLPCRHLCSCTDCDAFLDCCPVCNVAKKATLEALL
ncbi:E3 ubiquitin-protein ligase BOI-like [Salvia hispanica]|uniref:E3 ubiquitin-protein ligase BOI-like n=1 Tax=Salvia hispanica TaxID=49212 RepID=UPI0020093F8F|nr:E3 ubiquitin-protein ligase BOI-like [Salvia hispanica]